MKSKLGVLMVLSLMAASAAYSQVENDDMYFTSKDRARLVSARPVSFATVAQADDAQLGTTGNTVNPTDSYSGRGENPEYSAASAGQNGAPQYFVSNYQPTGVNQSLCNTCSGYNSPYYGNNNYYNGMNSMYGYGNPYSSMGMYGMGYPSYGMGMNYGMGYGMGMNYGMGYGMGYGSYGMGYGMGYPSYGMGYGSYGMGYGGGYGYYPSTLVIVDHRNSSSYGSRGSRSSAVSNSSYYNSRSNSGTGSGTSGRVSQIGGRASNQSMNSQYYERGWKSNPNIVTGSSSGGSTPSRSSFWGNSGSNNSGYSNMGSGTRSNWGGSGSGSGNTGRSSFGGGSSGGGGFSSGGGGGGSSGGGGGGRGRH